MRDEALLRELARAITRQEDLNDEEARAILFELALRIYALLLQLPSGQLQRQIAWPQLRDQILLELTGATRQLGPLLFSRIAAIELELQRIFATYFSVPPQPPRPITTVLDTTRVLSAPINELFTPSSTGIPPFALQLLRLIERSLITGVLMDTPAPELAAKVIQPRTRGGITSGIANRGTVANAWRERFKAITAGALWALVVPTAQRYAAVSTRQITEWEWNAILDPRTCPICRPLDGTTAPTPDLFPSGAPPLHPLCRCVVTPRFAREAI
jgi:SPP1 gp7 family putative phage head morphogenesis protein